MKTGDYPFDVADMQGDVDLNAYVSAKELNALRRRAFDKLLDNWKNSNFRDIDVGSCVSEGLAFTADIMPDTMSSDHEFLFFADHRKKNAIVRFAQKYAGEPDNNGKRVVPALPVAFFAEAGTDVSTVCFENTAVWCPPGIHSAAGVRVLKKGLENAFSLDVGYVILNSLNELQTVKEILIGSTLRKTPRIAAGPGCNAVNVVARKTLIDMGFDECAGGHPADILTEDGKRLSMYAHMCPAGYAERCGRWLEKGGRCPYSDPEKEFVLANRFGDRLEVIPGICGCYSLISLNGNNK